MGLDHVFDSPGAAAGRFVEQLMRDGRDLSDKVERLSHLLSEIRRELELFSERIAGGDAPNIAPTIVHAAALTGSSSRNLEGAAADIEELLLSIRTIDPWKWA